MGVLYCEVCGNSRIRKENDGFVCGACGCRYSLEDVRKMAALIKEEPIVSTPAVPEQPPMPASQPEPAPKMSAAAFMERAELFLEQKEFAQARQSCDRVLEINPEEMRAYLVRLFCDARVQREEELSNLPTPFDGWQSYQMLIRFADEGLKGRLVSYNAGIRERNETACKNSIYQRALDMENAARTEEEYRKAAELFATIPGWQDADMQAQQCTLEAETVKQKKTKKVKRIRRTVLWTSAVAVVLVFSIIFSISFVIPEIKYRKAVNLYNKGELKEARVKFEDMLEKTVVFKEINDRIPLEFRDYMINYRLYVLETADFSMGYKNSYDYFSGIEVKPQKEIRTDKNGNEEVIERKYTFDENGRLTSAFDPTVQDQLCKYKYDDDGNLIKAEYIRTETDEESGKTEETKCIFEYSYDSRGNRIRMEYIYKGTTREVHEYRYDKKGNCIRHDLTDYDDNVSVTDKYTYNKKGQLLKCITTDSEGNKEVLEKSYNNKGNLIKYSDGNDDSAAYTYDKKGNLVEVESRTSSSDGREIKETVIFDYNKKGNCIKMVISFMQDQDVYEYKYDRKGNCTQVIHTDLSGDEESKRIYEYSYDGKGNCIKIRFTNPGGKEYDCKFEYDKDGNLTRAQTPTNIRPNGYDDSETRYEDYVYYIDPEYSR